MKWIASLAAGLVFAGAAVAQNAPAAPEAAIPTYITASLALPMRGDDVYDDSRREIAQIMAFSEVKAGDTVLELVPGSGYWSKVFSAIVGPMGKVYLAVPTPMEKYSEATKSLPSRLANTQLLLQPADALSAPTPVDVVFTSQNYHDYPLSFMGPTDPAVLNKAVFDMLNPGGVYIIIDHAAQDGSGLRDADSLHRIDPQLVRQQVEAAGFEFVGQSDALSNPVDDRTLSVFNDEIRGYTDQFIYKFRKPAQ
ncbi:methyltransferase [Luteimonas sp. 8-5]|uniref:class I SAM-dependent methyltransferase n=1 Tax=Luteimonas sp. 8-5 TaxID=3039387 RepID=UPI00243637C4|nr:methyltransferase [Luteimonas sp. 8-5]MDG6347800.1 methyltransferase [Luteimonas sp. 8-5]